MNDYKPERLNKSDIIIVQSFQLISLVEIILSIKLEYYITTPFFAIGLIGLLGLYPNQLILVIKSLLGIF